MKFLQTSSFAGVKYSSLNILRVGVAFLFATTNNY